MPDDGKVQDWGENIYIVAGWWSVLGCCSTSWLRQELWTNRRWEQPLREFPTGHLQERIPCWGFDLLTTEMPINKYWMALICWHVLHNVGADGIGILGPRFFKARICEPFRTQAANKEGTLDSCSYLCEASWVTTNFLCIILWLTLQQEIKNSPLIVKYGWLGIPVYMEQKMWALKTFWTPRMAQTAAYGERCAWEAAVMFNCFWSSCTLGGSDSSAEYAAILVWELFPS